MKSFKEMLNQNKVLPESDLGLVSPGLETGDDKDAYNQDVINNYDKDSAIQVKTDVKESRIFNKILSELSEKVIVHVVSKKHGDVLVFNTIQDAEKYINSLDLDLKKDYFDIHTGSNTSEIDGLYKWGGVKGYWANYLEDKDTKPSWKTKILKTQIKEKLNEASELDYEDLVEELREKTQIVKTELDRIFNRVKYRFLLNVSYDKKEANKIQDDIWKELDKAQKMISKCYGKVG